MYVKIISHKLAKQKIIKNSGTNNTKYYKPCHFNGHLAGYKSGVDSNWGLSECTMKVGIEKII